MATDKLFEEFAPSTAAKWKAQIEKDLRGESYDEKMLWKTPEGLVIHPFYTSEDSGATAHLAAYQNQLLNADKPALAPRHWTNYQRIAVSDLSKANVKAMQLLHAGVDGLLFELNQPLDQAGFAALLKDIMLPFCEVSFQIAEGAEATLAAFLSYAKAQDVAPEAVHGYFLAPLEILSPEATAQLGILGREFPDFKVLVLAAEPAADMATYLARLLHKAAATIDALLSAGFSPDQAARELAFTFKLSDDYFRNITSLRALRILAHQMASLYGASIQPAEVKIRVETSIRIDQETKEDPYTNMLSNTNQAMAGILGGCDALLVLPHNQGIEEVDEFAERIARNVSTVLKEEAFFDKAADPVAGAYYLETLTDQIAEKAWETFREME